MLEPDYTEDAEAALDAIEKDPDRWRLWDAVCDTLHRICAEPGSAEVKRDGLRLFDPKGAVAWRAPVWCPSEDRDWEVLWYQDGGNAVILYVGDDSYRTG